MRLKNKRKDKKVVYPVNIALLAICGTVLLGVIGISYLRQNSTKIFPVTKYTPTKTDADRWMNAIKNDDEKSAILSASKLVPDEVPEIPQLDYMYLLKNNGLSLPVLTSPFNHFDYLRWKDAYEVKKIVDNASSKSDKPITLLFEELMTKKKPTATKDSMSLYEMFRIKLGQSKDKPYTSIIEIWEKGYASIDELFRLFSAMSFQLGYDVVVVGMYDSTFKLLYVVCEIHSADNSFLCDPMANKLWKGISAEELIDKHIQTPRGILSKCEYVLYNLPAETMDFKVFNQRLYNQLTELKTEGVPRFGISPQARMDSYITKYGNKKKKSRFSYWNFPFQSLKSSKELPEQWYSIDLKNNNIKKK